VLDGTDMHEEQLKVKIEKYLSEVFRENVRVSSIEPIGKKEGDEFKSFGYGKPYLIRCLRMEKEETLVLESMSENSFGHDHFSDRAQIMLWQNEASNKLPKHVRSLDVGAFTRDKSIISAGKAEEFFVLYEFVKGKEYALSLQKVLSTGRLYDTDVAMAASLAQYLATIHQKKINAPHLYRRRIRELLGHGECIMGLADNYPAGDPVGTAEALYRIEEKCLRWRWHLRNFSDRLCQVHGDFHPWNILVREDNDFTVLDRSRGEWGEAADDVTSMLINYLFFSLQKSGRLEGAFETLYKTFWEVYLNSTTDYLITAVMQPFFAWRAMVLANPIWYPGISQDLRKKLFHFIDTVLSVNEIDVMSINRYLL
jgi:hypothetical protein